MLRFAFSCLVMVFVVLFGWITFAAIVGSWDEVVKHQYRDEHYEYRYKPGDGTEHRFEYSPGRDRGHMTSIDPQERQTAYRRGQ